MLYNHGWKKQQTETDQKSLTKKGHKGKESNRTNPATGLKNHFKCIPLHKNCINKNRKGNQENVQKELCKFHPTRRAVTNSGYCFSISSHWAFINIYFFV